MHNPTGPWGRGTAQPSASTKSNPDSHTECRPVRASAQGRQREEQADPPREKKNEGGNKQTEQKKKGGGAKDRHTATKPRTHSARGGQTPKPGNTKGDIHEGPRKNTGGPPCQTRRHPVASTGPTEERAPRTRRHTPHWGSGGQKKKDMGAAQTKGEGGTETKRPKTGTGSGGHHKATTRQSRKPHTHPQPEKKGGGKGGGKRQPGQPPHTPTPQAAPPEGGGKRTRRTQEATRPNTEARKKRSAGETRTHTHTPQTPARKGGAQPKPVSRHTQPRPQPGVARSPLNPTPNTRTTKCSQKWQGKAETRAQAHAP